MKKVFVLLALVAVGSLAFAVDSPEPQTYDLSASATAKWVYNLDSGRHGFENSTDVKFRYYLINGASASKSGEGTYGMIEVKDITLKTKEFTEAKADPWGTDAIDISVSASIVSGNLKVTIFGAPGADYDNAVYVPLFAKDQGYDPGSALKPAITVGGGLGFTYSLGDFGSIGGMIASADKLDTNYLENYAAGVDATLNLVPSVLKLTAGAKFEFGAAERKIFTAKVDVTAGDLSAYAAFDGLYTTELAWDAAAGLAYKLFEGKDSLNFDMYYTEELSPTPAAGKFPAVNTPHNGDFGLKFVDAGGLMEGLGFTVGVFADDVLADPAHDPMWLSFGVSADYKAMLDDVKYVKPYGAFKMDMSSAEETYLKVGLEAGLITNTTFDVNFVAGTEKKDNNHYLADTAENKITISAKVSL